MRLTALPAAGLGLVLCCLLPPAEGAVAAPSGSAIATATQRVLSAGARHHSSPIKRYRRRRAP